MLKKQLQFEWKTIAGITEKELCDFAQEKNIQKQIAEMEEAQKQGYCSEYASLAAPFDTEVIEKIKKLVVTKKALRPTVLVVVGIGGSSLGTKAVQEAVLGRFYNAGNPELKIYFAQTVDADRMATIEAVVQTEITKGNKVLVNVVTKSGTTTETIASFQVLLALLQKAFPKNYADYIVATTDKDSVLWDIAQEEKFTLLEIPKLVGGRYSVFTSVGLFPLAMVGIDITELCRGAQVAARQMLDTDVMNNPAAISALVLALHYQKGLCIHDMFLFAIDLEGIGKWYRQLMAESIGKEKDITGQRVMTGITPTVSLGSVDLHSVAQLYLGGPRDKMTTFVTVKQKNNRVVVPPLFAFAEKFSHLTNKSFQEIMHAIVQGTKMAYLKNNRPFYSITLAQKNEFCIGQLLQFKMMEIMFLGYLLEVNPFDQPNVELYKKETKRLLG